jgi:dienelactone hydrolase
MFAIIGAVPTEKTSDAAAITAYVLCMLLRYPALWLCTTLASGAAAPSVTWIPAGLPPAPATGPALCVGAYLKPEQGKATLDAALAQFPDRAAWEAYGRHIRQRIQEGAGLAPWPKRTPLHPIVRARRTYDGYTVENIAFESVPGYFVTGNVYRPLHGKAPYPVVLTTHGHGALVKEPADVEKQGRFTETVQRRGGTFARMGALVLSIEMVGYGDSIGQVGQEAHKRPFTQTLQIWNATRALDYLLSLDGADPKRVAVTGESGGGTQTFLLTALDPRVTLRCRPIFSAAAPAKAGSPSTAAPTTSPTTSPLPPSPRRARCSSSPTAPTGRNTSPPSSSPSSKKSTATTAPGKTPPTSIFRWKNTTTVPRNAPPSIASSPSISVSASPPPSMRPDRSTSRP